MPPAEKKSSTKKMLQSVTGSVVFRGIGHQTKQGKSEVRNQRKTGQGIRFARVENNRKKSDNYRKKRVFLLDKRLEMWYNILVIGIGRKPYTIKRKRGATR